jgi:uncharacterized membrane protein
MVDFSGVKQIHNDMDSAYQILGLFKQIHSLSLIVEGILNRYGVDPAFKAEADHLFTVDQIEEIGSMISDIQTMRQNWDANHFSALSDYIILPA